MNWLETEVVQRAVEERTVGRGNGRRLGEGALHEFRSDYPPRLVLKNDVTAIIDEIEVDISENACEHCGASHRVWITDDVLWGLVPDEWQSARICVECFLLLTQA